MTTSGAIGQQAGPAQQVPPPAKLSEETGVPADASRVAFVLEAMAPGGSRRRLDIGDTVDAL